MNKIQQFSLCFSQTPTKAQKKLITSAFAKAVEVCWFIKGAAVQTLVQADTLSELKLDLGAPHEIFACSSACEEYGITEQQLETVGAQIAGLGTWVSFCIHSFSLDLSCCNLLPHAVVVSAPPDQTQELKQQIDLAFAAAAFDLEPKLLLLSPADQCLLDREGPLAKYLRSAPLYGIEHVISGEEAVMELRRILDQYQITLFDPDLHSHWGESFPPPPFAFIPSIS